MKHAFKSFALTLPAGWTDDSIMILSSPEVAPLRMMRAAPVQALRRTIVMKSQALTEAATDLAAIARGQEEMMKTMTQDCKVQARTSLTIAGAPAVVHEYTFMAEDLTHQIHAYFIVNGTFYTLCATSPAGSAKQLRDDFMAVAQSLQALA